MARRLPGGRGVHDDYVGRAESRTLREALQDDEDQWVISTIGDAYNAHHDVTGVLLGADSTRLYSLPRRGAKATLTEVRINVAAAAASSWVEVALYSYANREFSRIPGTLARLDSTATGQKSFDLKDLPKIEPSAPLFLGAKSNDATVALEGFQSGTAVAPGVVKNRSISHTGSLQAFYVLGQTTLAQNDPPMVAYLSKAASLVL